MLSLFLCLPFSLPFPPLAIPRWLWGLGKQSRVQDIKEGQWTKRFTCLVLFNLRLMPLNCKWSKANSPMANENCTTVPRKE